MSLAAKTEDERRLTATAYGGFAADLLTVPAPARAADMLSLGLLLVPDDVDANIALAVLLLRDRKPAAAAIRLDRVLGAHPDNREARLRRALMRAGFSADGRAAHDLESLSSTGETDWIALVAVQERTRRLLATGNYEKAIAYLNQIVPRFPSESSLRVALAFAAARSGKRSAAQEAVESALAAKAPPGEAARRRFGELPIRLLSPKTAVAEAAADARGPRLAAALSLTGQPATAPATAMPIVGQSR
jgi:tetratricopeptide (TPR) repeat protein